MVAHTPKKTKQVFVDKSYKLTRNRAPLTYMLSSKNTKRKPLLYFDEETGVNRALRYGRNQKSPFEDEQDGNVILEPIIFDDGFLYVPKENQVLQNLIQLQKVNVNMAEKFESLTEQISGLLALFEMSARTFAKSPAIQMAEKDKEFLNKIDRLLDQNKTIAKGLTLMEAKMREKLYGPMIPKKENPPQQPPPQNPRPAMQRGPPRY